MNPPDGDTRAGAVELEAEQEIDFARYGRAIAARWWLLVVGAVVGAIVGFLVSLGGGGSYKAAAQVYLGQPTAPDSAAPVTTSPTVIGLATNYATSEEAVRKAAAAAGMKPSRLRGQIQTRPIIGITGAKVGVPAPLLSITVTGSSRQKSQDAANALADAVVAKLSPYTNTKIASLEQQLAFDDNELAAIERRLATARRNQADLFQSKTLSTPEKFLAIANFNSVIVLDEQRRGTLEADRFLVRRQLSLAQDLERSSVTARAIAVKQDPTSRRTTVLVGAFIGLLLGLVATLLWDPVAARVWPSPA
jgi:capsular polysaccharide biosynthesis protein